VSNQSGKEALRKYEDEKGEGRRPRSQKDKVRAVSPDKTNGQQRKQKERAGKEEKRTKE